jgi:cellulose synthase/poly-beta-1,6-N-acetylglucosamine synthase-like glycosyltransferase
MGYLALCLFCKDENVYLEEWLTYHIALGVDHVYIIDNNSTIPLAETVKNWLRLGRVTVLCNQETTQGRQCRAYAAVLKEYGSRFQWICFIDVDEFLVPKTGTNMAAFLKDYETFGGLGVFWNCFGSRGHKVRQPSVINAFTKRAPDDWSSNNHIKIGRG